MDWAAAQAIVTAAITTATTAHDPTVSPAGWTNVFNLNALSLQEEFGIYIYAVYDGLRPIQIQGGTVGSV